MASNSQRPMCYMVFLPIGVALIAISACTSKPATKTELSGMNTTAESRASHVDLMCIGERITNPPESFHFSYKYHDASTSTEKEADITPQNMDITIKDQSGSRSYHGVRSDDVSWNRAVLDLSGLGMSAMMSRLDSLNDTSAIKPQNTGSLNGYETTQYLLDTTNVNSSDQQNFEFLFGKGSFEKGTVWTSSDGCAVKLVLDERVLLNGNLKDAHYEMARVRK
jgi:hypothetical protein